MSKYTFFFTEAAPFSQWYACEFEAEGLRFNCSEQYMMWGKARLFGDEEVAKEIMEAKHPREHKALGRKVRGYDEQKWRAHRERIVKDGNRAKFTQNAELLVLLEGTVGTELVEASPYDKIWRIGLAESDARAHDPSKWKGQNLLGKVLTELREELLAKKGAQGATE